MAGPVEGGDPEGMDDREETPPLLTKEQIEGHVSALKSLIKSHNQRNKGDPIRLDFESEDTEVQDLGIAKGKEVMDEDLGKPFKEARRTPLSSRIIEFAGPEYKMPSNIKLYDGTTDPEDHLSRFASVANSGEWPMPVCYRMFLQTLHGSARGWFERLSHDSINERADLREAFAARLDDFVRSEEAYARTELPKREVGETHRKMSLSFNKRDNRLSQKTHPGESRRNEYRSNYRNGRDVYLANRTKDDRAPYPLRGKSITIGKRGHYTNDCIQLRKQLEMASESEKLNHLVKDVRQRGRGPHGREAPQPAKVINVISVNLVKDKKRKGGDYRDVDEHLNIIPINILRGRFQETFDCRSGGGRILGQKVEGNPNGFGRVRRRNIKTIRKDRTGGRPGLKTLRAIPSTIHSMMKFSTPKGVATLVTRTIIIAECRRLEKKQMIEESFEGEIEVATTEEVLVNPSFSDQRVIIGRGLSEASCPKDYYPLPNIDCKVESVMGFRYKWFMDAYKGYHQIQMAEEEEEKTAFYTDQGMYRYTKMPFGLKNTRATYQRLVDSTFQYQIERNLEAYVDDMVIKSKDEKMLLADIAKTFDNLKRINMKLNPKKCSFGVEEGKFLGYMVTSKGIRANPKKTKALADLQSPRTLKEMQSLSEKLAALNRFLTKSAERSLPFFNTLKNITKENKHEYRWTKEAEEAFQQMKNLIMDLPSLTPPWEKESLYAYLACLQKLTLNEAEMNYAPMEKLALSLIHMTRRLRRYFEAYPVKVITDQPIKNILNNTKTFEKLAKYAAELGAYNITFIPRNAVKGQIDDTESWTLFTDGASSLKGSMAGLVLIGPSGIEYTYALRLTFPSTNYEAEYDALLAGLRIARQMNISNIEVKVDSKLVASQINGNYEASIDNMIKYLAKAREYATVFKSFCNTPKMGRSGILSLGRVTS
nr:reverse transcriptase domain-containing protein [Tanacetum cinerariifolium]